MRALLLSGAVAIALGCGAAHAGAQTAADALRNIEDLAASGRFTQARAALERWIEEHPSGAAGATAAERARALFLQGRFTSDAVRAEESYLGVVLSYPSSAYAPESLLLLGQAMLARGDATRALTYLDRLARDFPSSPHRATGLLWSARAQVQTGDWTAACETARSGLTGASPDPLTASLLRTEEELACSRRAANAATAPPAQAASRPGRAADPQARAGNAGGAATRTTPPPQQGTFTVQAAAVRSNENAEALAGRLRRIGFEARIALVEGSSLVRVRVGRYDSAAAARTEARRLRDAGFDAIVVDDARNERPARR